MERDIHGAWRSDSPAGEATERPESRTLVPAKNKHRANDYNVIVDMPDPLPVTEGELELLESELADFIAELLNK
jgi:hypothetical protein